MRIISVGSSLLRTLTEAYNLRRNIPKFWVKHIARVNTYWRAAARQQSVSTNELFMCAIYRFIFRDHGDRYHSVHSRRLLPALALRIVNASADSTNMTAVNCVRDKRIVYSYAYACRKIM